MIFIAEKLTVDFPFVRVDLYNIDKKIYFGELTFSPCCCVFPYINDEYNEKFGELLKI